jgi:TatD DNase family protein
VNSLDLFDAHAHMVAEEFSSDLERVLLEAQVEGVCAIVAVGENLAEAQKNLILARKHPLLKPAAGLYPTILDLEAASRVETFIREHHQALVAIGEVGLDYWKVQDEPGREVQREIFLSFVALSKELGLPLNIHSRSAGREAIRILREAGTHRVLLHAFDGKASSALEGIEAGYYFSIPPSIVRSPQKRKLVSRIPLDRLLLETDSPVLGPDPHLRNEPKNLQIPCQAIAEIKGVSVEEVAEVTMQNARCLFPRAFG